MELSVKENGTTLELTLKGRLDTVSAPELESRWEGLPGAWTEVVLDMEGVDYVSSAGLRVLLQGHKKMQGRFQLRKVTEAVMEVFEMTGFKEILNLA